jgi:hypothetical protein
MKIKMKIEKTQDLSTFEYLISFLFAFTLSKIFLVFF